MLAVFAHTAVHYEQSQLGTVSLTSFLQLVLFCLYCRAAGTLLRCRLLLILSLPASMLLLLLLLLLLPQVHTIQAYINILPSTTRTGVRVGLHARSNGVHVYKGTHSLSCRALAAAHAILLRLCWCCSVAPDPMFACAIGYV
jgi:hypothetical protein